MPQVVQAGGAMDDLDTIAAQFQEDVDRITIFVNGDETATYVTEDGRQVPSLSKVVASVEDMIRPDLAAIDSAVTASQAAASTAGQSAAAAADSAGAVATDAANAQAAAIATQADAIAAADDAARAEASKDAAGAARDEAVGAQTSVQQNADAAAGAATRAAASESAAADSAAQVGLDLDAVEELATEAAGNAIAAGQSATQAGQSATAAGQSATAAGQSATAAAQSARDAAASATETNNGLVLIETQGPTNVANVFANLTDYDVYELVFDGLLPTNNLQDLGIHFSYDNGATWATTTQYQYSYLFSTVANNTAVASGVSASNNLLLWGQCSNVATNPMWASYEGSIRFFNFHRVTVSPSALFEVAGVGSGSQAYGNLRGSGRLLALPGTPVNAFRIFCGSAGFSRGSLSLYGLRKVKS
jgi:hypothetical protein